MIAPIRIRRHELHHIPQPLHPSRPLFELPHHSRERHDIIRANILRIFLQYALLDVEDLSLKRSQMNRFDGRSYRATDRRRMRVGYTSRLVDQVDVDVAEMGGGGE